VPASYFYLYSLGVSGVFVYLQQDYKQFFPCTESNGCSGTSQYCGPEPLVSVPLSVDAYSSFEYCLNSREKLSKVGEGTYAVVYRGQFTVATATAINDIDCVQGREVTTGRQVAIKKIKVGQFKDGLDMSAIREVKYLREIHHPNVIEVSYYP
jgi:hypothetical protein